jgi:hypothetical protein
MVAAPWQLVGGVLGAGDHLQQAQKALSKGSLKEARYETLAGVASARDARRGLDADSPLLDVARLVPAIDDALGEMDHVVAAIGYSGDAALGALDIAQNALRGPDKIVTKVDPDDEKSDSLIRLDRIEAIARTIAQVRDDIRAFGDELAQVRVDRLPRRARGPLTDASEQAAEADELLADAEAGFAILPSFLGADGPRNYLIGMQNPAELRGTGGAMLQFALLSIDEGHPKLNKASTVYDVDTNREPLDIPLPPDAWYQQGIPDTRRFGNANWSPDWPFSARLTVDYAEATDARLPDVDIPEIHGVLLVDPYVMEELMPGVGRFRSDKHRVYVTGETVVNYLLYKAYAAKPVPRIRKARLTDIVDSFYRHMLKPDHPTELVNGLSTSLREKHMQVWLRDPREHAFVERMNWDAAFQKAANSDFFYAVQQNVGGNKLDYHAEMTTDLDVRVLGEGTVEVDSEVSIRNGVFLPQPRWALGNSGPNHRPMLNVYVPQDARLLEAAVTPEGYRIDGAAEGIVAWTGDVPAEHLELGKKVWSSVLGDATTFPPGMPPGETATVQLRYEVPGAVSFPGDRSVYRLVLQHQPKSHPETARVRFTLPDGAKGVRAPGWDEVVHDQAGVGRVLVWEKTLNEDIVLEVSWRN